MPSNRNIPPKRNNLIVEKTGTPTPRMSRFLEDISSISDAIVDLTGTPTNTELRDKVNEILTSLRDRGIIES